MYIYNVNLILRDTYSIMASSSSWTGHKSLQCRIFRSCCGCPLSSFSSLLWQAWPSYQRSSSGWSPWRGSSLHNDNWRSLPEATRLLQDESSSDVSMGWSWCWSRSLQLVCRLHPSGSVEQDGERTKSPVHCSWHAYKHRGGGGPCEEIAWNKTD